MRILMTGGRGQLGRALLTRDWPEGFVLLAPPREALDLSDTHSIRHYLLGQPIDGIINAGAFTAVDRAESESELAWRVNALAPAFLAQHAAEAGIPLIHVSTDYVFDGRKDGPYLEDDPTHPLNVYGASKLGGEWAIRTSKARHVILRTSWVVSAYGRNFVRSMLQLAQSRPLLKVVDDQWGGPTLANDLAAAVQTILRRHLAGSPAPSGVFHFSNSGATSWKGFAEAIFAASALQNAPVPELQGITTEQYPTPARRPLNSRLATGRIGEAFGIVPPPWQDGLPLIIREILKSLAEEAR
jgi:dTDP-4-dehydrorhamnose reductase